MLRRHLFGFAAATALLLSACGAASDGPTSATGPAAAAPAATATAAPAASTSVTSAASDVSTAAVASVLQFQAPLVGGGTYDGAAASGKVTAYWFWAPT